MSASTYALVERSRWILVVLGIWVVMAAAVFLWSQPGPASAFRVAGDHYPTPIATPTPGFPGVMEVDCDASAAGVQNDCTHSTGGTFSMQVHVTTPPEGGYAFFQAKLRWTDAILDYLPAVNPHDEALWPECDIAVRTDNQPGEPSVFLACLPLPALSEDDTFTGAVLQFQLQCLEDGNTPLGLVPPPGDPQGGTALGDNPLLLNATIECAAPTPTFTSTAAPTLTPLVAELAATPTAPIAATATATLVPGTPTAPASVAALPNTGGGSSAGGGAMMWPIATLAGAGALALGAAAWYARRRS